MYQILVTTGAERDLSGLPARERRIVLDAMESQLQSEPAVPTRNRKTLAALRPPWEGMEPVWQLRVGDVRVFYDVDEGDLRVYVRAVRRKPPHRTTEEIL